jgi:hypothetical protein
VVNDAGRTVLFALILGFALTSVAVLRGHFDIAGILAVTSFIIAAAAVIGACIHRKHKS